MKNLFIVASALILLSSCGGKEENNQEAEDTTANIESRDSNGLTIAFYNQDSLFLHFDYYLERDSVLTQQGLAFQNEVQRRTTALENYIRSQEEQARNGLLSEMQVAQVQQAIQQKQGELMQYQEMKGGEIEMKTMQELEAISKKIEGFAKEYCEENGLDMLLIKSAGGQFNYIHPSMDVTKQFTAFVNNRELELQAAIEE